MTTAANRNIPSRRCALLSSLERTRVCAHLSAFVHLIQEKFFGLHAILLYRSELPVSCVVIHPIYTRHTVIAQYLHNSFKPTKLLNINSKRTNLPRKLHNNFVSHTHSPAIRFFSPAVFSANKRAISSIMNLS